MKHIILSSAFLFSFLILRAQTDNVGAVAPVEHSSRDARLNYIKQFSRIAQSEMERAGVPASIKLAQAILESNAGQSTLAREANNHFGIKCHKDWKGKEYFKEDDDYVNGVLHKSCFRVYKHAEQSFEDHSAFLRDPKKYQRYGSLFELNRTDYKSWAYGLQSAGYATSGTYAESLIRVIEDYQLHHYDTQGPVDPNLPPGTSLPTAGTEPTRPTGGGVLGRGKRKTETQRVGFTGHINDVKAVYAQSGFTLQTLARKYGLSPAKVACYNDCQIAVTDQLHDNEIVYLAKKRKKYRGRQKSVIVQKDESMFELAQRYGVTLVSLYDRNNMQGGTEAAEGETIYLKGKKRSDSPRTREKSEPGKPKPTVPDPSPYKPSDNELFELGEGGVTQPTTGQGTSTPRPAPGRPATSGAERPDVTSVPTGGNSGANTQPEPPKKPTGMVESVPRPTAPASTIPAATPAGFHTVVKGDTLYNISKRYGLTVDQVRELNGLPGNDIKIGQLLKVK